jgi:hypothetical protein
MLFDVALGKAKFGPLRVLDSFLENGQNVVLSMSEFLLV